MKIKILKEAVDKTIELEPIGKTADSESTWADYPDADNKGWEAIPADQTLPKKTMPTSAGPEDLLKSKGFDNIKRLGSGMVGNVYSADWSSGLEIAVKVVPKGAIEIALPNGGHFRWSGEKEIRAYDGIRKAREQSKNIEKHFPEVYAIMPGGDNYFIFMERLTDEGPYTSVIDELFAGTEALVQPGKDLIDQGAFKDPSKRLFMYIKSDKSRNLILDRLLDNIQPKAKEKAKEWASNWWKWVNADKETLPSSYELIDELFSGDEKAQDILLDGFGNLQKEFEDNSWMSYVLLRILKVVKEHDLQGFHMNYKNIASQWVDLGRKGAPIGWYHRPPTRKAAFGGEEDDVASVYKEAESIKRALDDLEDIMGLVGVDMHDKNVMMRPIDGSIVIVDVGLFKPRSELDEAKSELPDQVKSKDRSITIADNVWKKSGLEEALYDMSFDKSKLTIKNRLNPAIWDKKQIDSEIREKLLEIAKDFEKDSHIEGKVENITLTGGNASYNWHKTSDLDIHLVVDYKRFGKDGKLIKEIMDLERIKWNSDHNVLIHGHEVEIYVQDKHEDHYSGGIFSLEGNNWIIEPLPTKEDYDYNAVLKKAKAIAGDINAVKRLYDEENYEKAHKQGEKLKEKIRNMRSVGLDRDGLWSTENIAFKLLRNGGYLDHLGQLYGNSYDNMSSYGGKSTITVSILTVMGEKKKKKRKNKYHFGFSDWFYGGGYGDGD